MNESGPRAWYEARPHVLAVLVATILLWLTDITKHTINTLNERLATIEHSERRIEKLEERLTRLETQPQRRPDSTP